MGRKLSIGGGHPEVQHRFRSARVRAGEASAAARRTFRSRTHRPSASLRLPRSQSGRRERGQRGLQASVNSCGMHMRRPARFRPESATCGAISTDPEPDSAKFGPSPAQLCQISAGIRWDAEICPFCWHSLVEPEPHFADFGESRAGVDRTRSTPARLWPTSAKMLVGFDQT